MAKHWYVVHTYAGYENKVKNDLQHRIETYGLEDQIVDIQIPTEEVVKIRNDGKRTSVEANAFPGYVLVRMEVDDNSWAVVRNTNGVTGFVGIEGKPTPLRRSEFNKMMRRANPTTPEAPQRTVETEFEVGMTVRVVRGPLEKFEGKITEVMTDAGKVKVSLTIFGRETPVELTMDQIEIIV